MTQFKDPELLVASLKALGIREVSLYDTARALEGYLGDQREQTAEIIIPRRAVGGASNDIGFKKQANGTFNAIISDYDSRFYNNAWLTKLKTEYSEAGVMKQAKLHGLQFAGRKIVNGKTQLMFVKA